MLRTASIVCLCLIILLISTAAINAGGEKDQAAWKMRIELSYVITSGNTDTQTLSGKLRAGKEGEVYRHTLKGSLLRAEGRGVETANK